MKIAHIDNEIDVLKIRYAVSVLKCELSKSIVLGVLFFATGHIQEFLFALAVLFPLRFFSGGIHFETNAKCFLFSLGFFALCIWALPKIYVPSGILLAMIALSGALHIISPPLASKKRPIKSKRRYSFLKIGTRFAVCFICGLLCFMLFHEMIVYLKIGAWILTLQSIQLLSQYHCGFVKGRNNVSEIN